MTWVVLGSSGAGEGKPIDGSVAVVSEAPPRGASEPTEVRSARRESSDAEGEVETPGVEIVISRERSTERSEPLLFVEEEMNVAGYKKQGFTRDGVKEGVWRTYDPLGRLWQEVNYSRGKLEGEATTWDMEHAVVIESVSYVRGVLNGPTRRWFRNGQPSSTEAYERGKLDGPSSHWYGNGVKQAELNYKNGLLNGACYYFDEAGVLDEALSGTYLDAKRVGDL